MKGSMEEWRADFVARQAARSKAACAAAAAAGEALASSSKAGVQISPFQQWQQASVLEQVCSCSFIAYFSCTLRLIEFDRECPCPTCQILDGKFSRVL